MMGQKSENKRTVAVEEIVAHLKKLAEENLQLTPEQIGRIHPDLPMVEGLQLDSLAQVTLITAIEDDFGFLLEPEDREQLHTIGDLVQMIQDRATKTLGSCS